MLVEIEDNVIFLNETQLTRNLQRPEPIDPAQIRSGSELKTGKTVIPIEYGKEFPPVIVHGKVFIEGPYRYIKGLTVIGGEIIETKLSLSAYAVDPTPNGEWETGKYLINPHARQNSTGKVALFDSRKAG